ETKSALDAERAELQLERSRIEAERIDFGLQLELLRDELVRLRKETEALKAVNARLKLSIGQHPAGDSAGRRRSLPLDDNGLPSSEKKPRVS
ncbi:hypothetical protein AAVH_27668, partial [Aphelenchoides avenae]